MSIFHSATAFIWMAAATLLSAPASAAAPLAVVSAASYTTPVAPGALASAFGADLATGIQPAPAQWPTTLAGTTVTVTDSAGQTAPAPLLFVSPTQVNFEIPPQAASGPATVTVTSADGAVSSGAAQIAPVAPSLFAANADGQGVAAAVVAQGQNSSPVFYCGAAPLSFVPIPVNFNQSTLALYGTGIRGHSPSGVACSVGGAPVPVLSAGASSEYAGLDEVDVSLSAGLANQGLLNIVLTVDGQASNAVTIDSNSADFFVAPNGSDLWSGTEPAPNAAATDGPFASVAQAQLSVRGLLKSSPGRSLTVMLRGGTYYLPLSPTNPGTLTFAAGDSGSASAPITWENYPAETPIVSGGEPVGKGGLGRAWTNVSSSLWQVSLPANTQPFEDLFYNGERRLRSRVESSTGVGYYMKGGTCYDTTTSLAVATSQCNLGTFLRVAAVVPPTGANSACPSATGDASQGSKCLDRFGYNPRDPIATWANLNPAGSPCGGASTSYPMGDIEVILFEAWTVEEMRVSCIDTTNQIIYFTGKMQGGGSSGAANTFNSFGPTAGHRYIVENSKDAFDAAASAGQTGLWFLDRSTSPWTLNYLANAGENPNSDSVVIAQAQSISSTGGSLVSAANLSYVTFHGITFEVDNYVPPAAGFSADVNGQTTLPEAIDCESCRQVTFDSISVRHTAASGILIASASNLSGPPASNDLIENSAFYDIGASGIRIGHQPAASDAAASATQNVTVQNNIVQGYSRIFAAGEGIAQGSGHDISYLYNDITDGYHAAISVCTVVCTPYAANGFDIVSQYNRIWNIMQGLTSDGGTLYYNTGGPQGSGAGNKILNNLLHDTTDSSIVDSGVAGSAYGGEGIYLDNQSAGVDVENNVVYHMSAHTALMSAGPAAGQPANTFRNNIFAYGRIAMFDENIAWANQGCASPSLRVSFTSNIFYFDRDDSTGFYITHGCAWSCGLNYNQYQNFQGNLYWRADGQFASYNKGFHVQKQEPADDTMCGDTLSPASTWTFLTFLQWQDGTPPNGAPPAMSEDVAGTVTVNPGFGSTGQPSDYLLSTNPIAGFDYTKTNDTLMHAGRNNPVILPPPVPETFPTYLYTDF